MAGPADVAGVPAGGHVEDTICASEEGIPGSVPAGEYAAVVLVTALE